MQNLVVLDGHHDPGGAYAEIRFLQGNEAYNVVNRDVLGQAL